MVSHGLVKWLISLTENRAENEVILSNHLMKKTLHITLPPTLFVLYLPPLLVSFILEGLGNISFPK